MRPKINVLVNEDGLIKAITREMTDEEYAEFLDMIRMAEAEATPEGGVTDEHR